MAVAVLRYLDTPTPLSLEPAREGAGVGAVNPDQVQAWKLARTGLADEGLGAEAVMQVGGMDMGEKDEARAIDENVPLAACDPLCSVIAAPLEALGFGGSGSALAFASRRPLRRPARASLQ